MKEGKGRGKGKEEFTKERERDEKEGKREEMKEGKGKGRGKGKKRSLTKKENVMRKEGRRKEMREGKEAEGTLHFQIGFSVRRSGFSSVLLLFLFSPSSLLTLSLSFLLLQFLPHFPPTPQPWASR